MPNNQRPTLFISDLHLSEDRPELTAAFRHFVETLATQAQALYILGDFFNIWLGDDDPSPLTAEVADILSTLNSADVHVYLMHGNRDFLLGTDYSRRCHARLVAPPCVVRLFGRDYLLMHGDELCTDDLEYQQLRNMVRNPQWQKEILQRPLEERQALAAQLRAKSKAMSSNKPEDIMDVSPVAVSSTMQHNGVKYLIHGHTHRPAVHDFKLEGNPARRIVLGDWGAKGWYLEINTQGENLVSFDID